MELVSKIGAKKWSLIAQSLPGRIGKQCRERCVLVDGFDVFVFLIRYVGTCLSLCSC